MNSTSSGVQSPADASDGGGGDLAVEALVIVLALISCVLRFYSRLSSKLGLWWDDWLILVAAITTLATAALLLAGDSIDPTGTWVADHPDPLYRYTEKDQLYLKLSFISSVIYFTIAATTKGGILCMYHRIFSVDKGFRQSLYVVSFLVLSWWIGNTIATLVNCVPLEWSWINGLSDPQYCFNFNVYWMASGAIEVALDILILALPIRAVLELRMSRKKKATVVIVFLFGGFTVVTGIVRVILGYVPGSRTPSYSKSEVWTTIHTGMSIICASLPVCWPLVKCVRRSRMAKQFSKLPGLAGFYDTDVADSSNNRPQLYPVDSHETGYSRPLSDKDNMGLIYNRIDDSELRDVSSSSTDRSLHLEEGPTDMTLGSTCYHYPRSLRRYNDIANTKTSSLIRLTLNLEDMPLTFEPCYESHATGPGR